MSTPIPIACAVRESFTHGSGKPTGVHLSREGDRVRVAMTWDGAERFSETLSVKAVEMMLYGFTPSGSTV